MPPDLGIFLNAGDASSTGARPTRTWTGSGTTSATSTHRSWRSSIIPLSILPASVAASIWALLTFGFVAWSLWLLGVRDWRCYPVALLWPFTREAVEYGAIGPLLLLIVAFLWRYRDSTWGAATATASAVAAKLFLWPLALWLAFTGRIRTAGLSIAITLVLVLVPWIAIGLRRTEAVPSVAPGGRGPAGLPLVQRHRARPLARRLIRSSRRFSPCCWESRSSRSPSARRATTG